MIGIVLAAVLSWPGTGEAAAAKRPMKMIWGPNELPGGQSAFPLYERLGVDVLQVQLQWSDVALRRPADARDPSDAAYAWPEAVTTAVREARRSGMRVMLMVRNTPGWANGGRSVARVPDDDGDYADFVVAASRRYRSVRHWMIWGEPQRGDQFRPMPANSRVGPRRYAKLLDTAYRALKRERRRNQVIGGNTWSYGVVSPALFLRYMRLPNGKPPRLDFYGHNPFSVRFPNIRRPIYYTGLRDISDTDTLARQVRRTYRRQKGPTPKLWLSEFTVPSAPNDVFNISVSERQQARWVRAAFKLARKERRSVAALGWFRLLDTPELSSGLLRADGSPKPSLRAFRRAR